MLQPHVVVRWRKPNHGYYTDRVPPRRAAIKKNLAGRAAAEGITERSLLERLVAEGLDTLDHPGIVFRDGPTGRRAGLAMGPDVWEIVSALRFTKGSPTKRVAVLAEQFDLHSRHIRIAIDYAATHREVIDAQVAANDAAAEQVRHLAESRVLITENVKDFVIATDLVVVGVLKSRIPAEGMAEHLADLLNAWAAADPRPYVGMHWPKIDT